ncbi:PKD domain-containing protein [Scytonema hofmannii]
MVAGNTATDVLNPSHTYTVDGEYTVTLTITVNAGAVSNDTMTVTVKKPPTMTASDVSIIEGDNGNKYAVFTASLSEASPVIYIDQSERFVYWVKR